MSLVILGRTDFWGFALACFVFILAGQKHSHFTPLCRKVAVSCVDDQCSLKRITGHCFTFPLLTFLWRQNTISGVRSKNPRSFFKLIPHLQCCKPINCCFIFLPQRGQILLVVLIRIPPGKPVLVFTFCLCGMQFFKYLKSCPFSIFKRIEFFSIIIPETLISEIDSKISITTFFYGNIFALIFFAVGLFFWIKSPFFIVKILPAWSSFP